jgi:hypothetical protein
LSRAPFWHFYCTSISSFIVAVKKEFLLLVSAPDPSVTSLCRVTLDIPGDSSSLIFFFLIYCLFIHFCWSMHGSGVGLFVFFSMRIIIHSLIRPLLFLPGFVFREPTHDYHDFAFLLHHRFRYRHQSLSFHYQSWSILLRFASI